MSSALKFAAVLLFLSSTAAHAAPLPRYEEGQAFIFDNGRVEQVAEVTRDRVVWSARSGRPYVRSVNPVVPILEWSFRGQTGTRTIVGDPDRLWPLAQGRRVQFRTVNVAKESGRNTRRSVHLWTCTVQRLQNVKVPAGTFQSYPIRCDRFSPNSMRVLERLTWYFAPEVDHYVRREARDMSDGTTETYSLFAALPPREANTIRIEALANQARAQAR
jgi:hypothetical protein